VVKEIIFEDLVARADAGDTCAQYELALCYFHGKEVPENKCRAINYMVKSAEEGYVSAMQFLSKIYYEGNGVNKDLKMSFFWGEQAQKEICNKLVLPIKPLFDLEKVDKKYDKCFEALEARVFKLSSKVECQSKIQSLIVSNLQATMQKNIKGVEKLATDLQKQKKKVQIAIVLIYIAVIGVVWKLIYVMDLVKYLGTVG